MLGTLISVLTVSPRRYLLVGVSTLSIMGCSSELSRGQAADLVRARLESQSVVSEITVRGLALRQLIDAGHLVIASEKQHCGIGPCSDVRPVDGPDRLFSNVDGRYYLRVPEQDNALRLKLRVPLRPSNVRITGITQNNLMAVVEFTFSYDVPAAIAGLNTTAKYQTFAGPQNLSYVQAWPGGADVLAPQSGRWTMQRYDDGWRIAQ